MSERPVERHVLEGLLYLNDGEIVEIDGTPLHEGIGHLDGRNVRIIVDEPVTEIMLLPLAEYNQMMEDINLLNALRAAGVDNWGGWDDAINMLEERESEE